MDIEDYLLKSTWGAASRQAGIQTIGGKYESLYLRGLVHARAVVFVTHDFIVRGTVVGRNIASNVLIVEGTARLEGISVYSLKVKGRILAHKLTASEVVIQGTIEAEEIGTRVAELVLQGDELSRIGTLRAEYLRVRADDVGARLTISSVDAAIVSVANADIASIKGRNVTIGENCTVGEVFYSQSLQIRGDSVVNKISKMSDYSPSPG